MLEVTADRHPQTTTTKKQKKLKYITDFTSYYTNQFLENIIERSTSIREYSLSYIMSDSARLRATELKKKRYDNEKTR